MKRFIKGIDRDQGTLFPERLEDWISEDNPVRDDSMLPDGQAETVFGLFLTKLPKELVLSDTSNPFTLVLEKTIIIDALDTMDLAAQLARAGS